MGKKANRRWEENFLRALALTCNVSASARQAGTTRKTAYEHRKKYAEFRKEWDSALEEAVDRLERKAYDIAYNGSEKLLMFFLTHRKPEVYGNKVAHEHAGPGGGPIHTKTDAKVDFDPSILKDENVRESLDAIAKRMEGYSGSDSFEMVE